MSHLSVPQFIVNEYFHYFEAQGCNEIILLHRIILEFKTAKYCAL